MLALATHTLPKALTDHNISLTTGMQAFWDFIAEQFPDEEQQKAARAIGTELKNEHMALFVHSLLTLTWDDIQNAVVKCGGKKTWVRQIEILLDHKFEPASKHSSALTQLNANSMSTGSRQYLASVASQKKSSATAANKGEGKELRWFEKYEVYGAEHREKDERLGEYLERVGELDDLELDKETILGLCERTNDPENSILHPNDTKAVTNFVFWYIWDKYHDVRGSSRLFRHLQKLLYKIVKKPNNPGVRWFEKLRMRFESGRRNNAEVRTSPFICAAPLLTRCWAFLTRRMCTSMPSGSEVPFRARPRNERNRAGNKRQNWQQGSTACHRRRQRWRRRRRRSRSC